MTNQTRAGPCSPTAPVRRQSHSSASRVRLAMKSLANDVTAEVALWCELLQSGVRDQVEQHQRRDYEPALQSSKD